MVNKVFLKDFVFSSMVKKEISIEFSEEANEEYNKLNEAVYDEIKKGITNSENQTLLRSIKRAIEILRINPVVGIQIPKTFFPSIYLQKYDANNLWKINLSGYWRMIYTIISDEVKIITLILDIVNHKRYNKIFGYRKK